MSMESRSLAVVIPAFKAQFLTAALDSLAAQTSRGFTVYIGDDASPESLREIVDAFADRLAIVYQRFEKNLGGTSLVAHWHRCIAMTDEPWIWVFSDDDMASADCVAAFEQARAGDRGGVELYRFDLSIVNSSDVEVTRPAPHPEYETAAELLLAMLTSRVRQWRAADHIFSRAAFERHGGFQEFPAALFSDSATWIKFSSPRGVQTLPGAVLRWRAHDKSVSSQTGKYRREYLEAIQRFCAWLQEWIAAEHPDRRCEMERQNRIWFFKQTSLLCGQLSEPEIEELWKFSRKIWPRSFAACVAGAIGLRLRPQLRRLGVFQRYTAVRQQWRLRTHYKALQTRAASGDE
jgi:glycosyltransferase involved in cell wall biosynthesis